jgi:hypothetical protein
LDESIEARVLAERGRRFGVEELAIAMLKHIP